MISATDYIIGIDEAGRGPLAGPVLLAAVKIKPNRLVDLPLDRDSKRLSVKERDHWFEIIKREAGQGNLDFVFTLAAATAIDQRGIVPCLSTATARVLCRLEATASDQILLDGNLRAPAEYLNQQTIIRGDETERVIALASIVAKVVRDRLMIRLDRHYPEYGFATHKGYATEEHYLALLRYGRSPIHRRSFTKFLDAYYD